MTRGTFAFFDIDSEYPLSLDLYISIEFNGDMGPKMECGKKYLPQFAKVDTLQDFEQFLRKVASDYGYSLEDGEMPYKKYSFDCMSMVGNRFEFDVSENTKDTKDDPWATYFHYSDYGYVKSSKNAAGVVHIKLHDRNDNWVALYSSNVVIAYCYGDYIFSDWKEVSGKPVTLQFTKKKDLLALENVVNLLRSGIETVEFAQFPDKDKTSITHADFKQISCTNVKVKRVDTGMTKAEAKSAISGGTWCFPAKDYKYDTIKAQLEQSIIDVLGIADVEVSDFDSSIVEY